MTGTLQKLSYKNGILFGGEWATKKLTIQKLWNTLRMELRGQSLYLHFMLSKTNFFKIICTLPFSASSIVANFKHHSRL